MVVELVQHFSLTVSLSSPESSQGEYCGLGRMAAATGYFLLTVFIQVFYDVIVIYWGYPILAFVQA